MVSTTAPIDVNKEHQQIGFEIVHPNYEITAPQSDLKVQIYQNNRYDNMVKNIQPLTIAKDRIIYQFNRDLIFEAGNEYRRIEFLSNKYNGMGVQRIQFHRPAPVLAAGAVAASRNRPVRPGRTIEILS